MAKPPVKINEDDLCHALEVYGGNLRNVARKLKCSYSTVVKWVNTNPKAKEARLDSIVDIVEMAENNLYDMVEDGDRTATLFVLKTLARNKYGEQANQESVQEEPITYELDEGLDNSEDTTNG